MNDHDGGRRPSFLGLWVGRLAFWICMGPACYVRYVPHH